jgi:hypothetical protein
MTHENIIVVPAKARIQRLSLDEALGPRLRGDDEIAA